MMPRRMKVFRTPAGFHDAYVAAPSRKAALAAWGADVDLFARGAAEEVTDPALTEAPLAAPGTIVRLSRGTAEEHLATAPAPRRRRAGVPKPPATKQAARPERAKRPSRAALDNAEATLAAAEERHRTERRALERRRVALDKEERAAQQRWRREATTLEEAVADARSRYDAALAAWRE